MTRKSNEKRARTYAWTSIVEGQLNANRRAKGASLRQAFPHLRSNRHERSRCIGVDYFAVELDANLADMAGLRLATVSTVSLISVGAVVGRGGLGRMFADGYERRINIELWAALVATMALALVFDLLIYAAGRQATPWTRRVRGAVL